MKDRLSISKLPDAEFEIMKIIWANIPPISTAEINRQINKNWKIQTLTVLLQRLVERGFLYSEKPLNERLYSPNPSITKEQYFKFSERHYSEQFHEIIWTSGRPRLKIGTQTHDCYISGLKIVFNALRTEPDGTYISSKEGNWIAFAPISGLWYVPPNTSFRHAKRIKFEEWLLEEEIIDSISLETVDDLLYKAYIKKDITLIFLFTFSDLASEKQLCRLYKQAAEMDDITSLSILNGRAAALMTTDEIDALAKDTFKQSGATFGILISKASNSCQDALLAKSIEKNNVPAFAQIFPYSGKRLSSDKLHNLADWLMKKNNIAMFSIVSPQLEDDSLQTFLQKSIDQNRITFFSISLNLIAPKLSQCKLDDMADMLYKKSMIAFFSNILEYISANKQGELYSKAVKNNNIVFKCIFESQ